MRLAAVLLGLLLSACADGDGVDADLAGTYELAPGDFAKAALHRRRLLGEGRLAESTPSERRVVEATWKQAAVDEANRTAMRLTLSADGRFVARFRFGREEGASAGTWIRQGDEVLLTTTAEKGRRLQKPYRTRALIRDETLRVEGERVPIPFTLSRKRP